MTTQSRRRRGPLRAALAVCTLAASAAGSPAAAAPEPDEPWDPAAAVAPTRYSGTLAPGADTAAPALDPPRRQWTRLFEPDGRFLAASEHGATGAAPAQAHAPAQHAPPASDARGVVRAVDRANAEITIAHGPITRLGMPGMTMAFRVRDPALLDGIEAGDEVGFTVEMKDSGFYVIGVQR